MVRILVRPVFLVAITLLLPLFIGCSGLFGDSREQANDSVAKANEAIDEHNRLFEEARSTYEEAKEAVESGDEPSGEVERFTQTRQNMEEAQGRLSEAKEPLAEIQDLNVEPEIKEYAGLLSEALDAQIAAEDREIDFYRILESDPGLEDDRRRALDILAEVDDGYQKAKDDYERAQELADANPELIKKS
jgi:hypothetical protein